MMVNNTHMRFPRVKFLMMALLGLIMTPTLNAQQNEDIFPGADERSPSRAQYFSWINNTNEGATEAQSLVNLDFFAWLHTNYGMTLDIYAFDAGAIDGKRFYGSVRSARFKKQFPNGFAPIYRKARSMGTRLGVWGGPDGFGDTPEETAERTTQMVDLCKDFEFALFKFDAVCGALRPEKEDDFIRMMIECRKYSPDLILLNHRLGLNKGKAYATTFLWGGQETYIDVFSSNRQTAPHHRAGALSRGLVPGLKRLTEDHGTCISSCLDYWDDDLILQAFNRCLILAPEIYGNPWLLRDDEFPKLARIFNLHKKYREIMVDGIELPASYGPYAVARGDRNTRLITLRNLSWNDTSYLIKLDKEIGLGPADQIVLRQFHPTEKLLGTYTFGDTVMVMVPSFRACLLEVSSKACEEPAVTGVDFNVIQDVTDKPVHIELLGMPGTEAACVVVDPEKYARVWLDGKEVSRVAQPLELQFGGNSLSLPYHRKLADLNESDLTSMEEAFYEATVFAADNNALEVRSIQRSGWSQVPEVLKAQQAFFKQDVFVDRGIWDKNLFDGDLKTGFWPSGKYRIDQRVKGGCFRLDMGEIMLLDQLLLHVPDYFSLEPLLKDEAYYVEVSADLITWKQLSFMADTLIQIVLDDPVRYVRINYFPQRINEIEGIIHGKKADRRGWRASNLFAASHKMTARKLWRAELELDEWVDHSYLCIAINGVHGEEGAYAALRVDGQIVGCPDRAVSYPSNTWEYVQARSAENYTYYVPMSRDMIGKPIEVFVMGYQDEHLDLHPEVWITAYPAPFKKKILLLERK